MHADGLNELPRDMPGRAASNLVFCAKKRDVLPCWEWFDKNMAAAEPAGLVFEQQRARSGHARRPNAAGPGNEKRYPCMQSRGFNIDQPTITRHPINGWYTLLNLRALRSSVLICGKSFLRTGERALPAGQRHDIDPNYCGMVHRQFTGRRCRASGRTGRELTRRHQARRPRWPAAGRIGRKT